MFTVKTYPQGTFSWADCISTDTEKAKPFYKALMGWEAQDIPMGNGASYTMFQKDGTTVAGFGPMQPEMQAQGIPSHWMNYITVDDVDAMVGKVKEAGGTVLAGPMDVFEEGRMLVLQDPTGARVSLWQAKNHIGAGLVNTVGAMCWNELATKDLDAAKDFYTKLVGWQYATGPNDYQMIQNNGRMNGGMMQMTEAWGDVPPSWSVYFTVADIEASTKKVEALGGKVHMATMDAGETGRFSVIEDPAGAVLYIMQLNSVDSWQE